METKSSLIMCEDFYSIQGEGKSLGAPSVFLRLAGCNLRCAGFSYKHPETGEHLGCDTKAVWTKGERQDFEAILARWESEGWLAALNDGAHLVVTGGEPLIQQDALIDFIKLLDTKTNSPAFIEIETNATFIMDDDLLGRLNQINASPKLLHSGELTAYKTNVIAQLAKTEKAVFKFVVASESDLMEIMARYVDLFSIPRQRVWLMPEAGTKSSLEAKQAALIELAKKYRFHYSTRLHLSVWDEATGV